MDSFQAQEQSITLTEARPKNEPFKISSGPVSRARVGEEGPFRCFLVVPLLLAWLERREARGERRDRRATPAPEMITRSKLVEQLRDYQIRSYHKWGALSFFSPNPQISTRYSIWNHTCDL